MSTIRWTNARPLKISSAKPWMKQKSCFERVFIIIRNIDVDGPIAFQFYIFPAIRYIRSPESKGDSDAINCFLGLLKFRLKHESESVQPVAQEFAQVCNFIVEHYDRFDVNPEVYGDLRNDYKLISRQLSAA